MNVRVCKKRVFESRQDALNAAHATGRQSKVSARPPLAYRCDRCRKPNGQKAWHWANYRPGSRRTR